VENSNREVANTLGRLHQSNLVVPRCKTRLVKDSGFYVVEN
jgi:hypothetical protein